jgi:hypothetical protein
LNPSSSGFVTCISSRFTNLCNLRKLRIGFGRFAEIASGRETQVHPILVSLHRLPFRDFTAREVPWPHPGFDSLKNCYFAASGALVGGVDDVWTGANPVALDRDLAGDSKCAAGLK